MADFGVDVSAWCDRALARGQQVFQSIAFDLVERVQELTPVDTGFLRSNWTAMRLGDAEPVAGRVPPPGAAIVQAVVGQVLVIINPVIYARRIEFGFTGEDSLGRHYNQPGRHMVAQTISEAPMIAQRAFERIAG